jgi:hypothetical protein
VYNPNQVALKKFRLEAQGVLRLPIALFYPGRRFRLWRKEARKVREIAPGVIHFHAQADAPIQFT